MKKTWRDDFSDEEKKKIVHGMWNFNDEDFIPMIYEMNENYFKRIYKVKVLDIKEYDPILNERNFTTAKAYDYFEGDLNEVEKSTNRNERLSPELNINEVLQMDGKFMLIQGKTYRVYFDFIDVIGDKYDTAMYDIIPSAKALNYGFIFQTSVSTTKHFNPVIPFFDNTYGYILSTNMYTPVTVNIPKGTFLAYMKRKL